MTGSLPSWPGCRRCGSRRFADQLGQPGESAAAGDPVRRAAIRRAEQRPSQSGRRERARRSTPNTPGRRRRPAATGSSREAPASRRRRATAATAGRSDERQPVGVSSYRAARPPRAASRPGCTTYERRVARPRSAPSSPPARATPVRRRARAPATRRPPAPRDGRCRPSGPPRRARRAARRGRRRWVRPHPRRRRQVAGPRRHPGPGGAVLSRAALRGAVLRRAAAASPGGGRVGFGRGEQRRGWLRLPGVIEPAQRHSGTSSNACFNSSELSLLVSSALASYSLLRVSTAARTPS